MKRFLWLLVVLLFGCDDSDVEMRALDVLANGMAHAHIRCVMTLTPDWSGGYPGTYEATRMQDGSCLAFVSAGAASAGSFSPRALGAALDCEVTAGAGSGMDQHFSVADGDVDVLYEHVSQPNDTEAFAVDTYCTGFNFEAFGAE